MTANLNLFKEQSKNQKATPEEMDVKPFLNDLFGNDIDFSIPQRLDVGPKEAIAILAKNTRNRIASHNHVNWLAEQMMAGLWKYAGQVIPFSTEGILLDRQHTLMAVVKSEIAQSFIIECGIEPNAYFVIDTGKRRSPSDILSREGYKSASLLAAIVLRAIALRIGAYSSVKAKGLTGSTSGGSKKISTFLVTNENVLAELRSSEREYLESAKMGRSFFSFNKDVTTSFWGAIYHFFSEHDEKAAGRFLMGVAKGTNISEDSTEFTLKRKLFLMNEDRLNKGITYTPREYVFYFVYAFNKFLKGEKMRRTVTYHRSVDVPQLGE